MALNERQFNLLKLLMNKEKQTQRELAKKSRLSRSLCK